MIILSLKMFSYIISKIKTLLSSDFIEDFYFDKAKLPYNYDNANLFDFLNPITMKDKTFWKFSLFKCDSINLFVHQNSNIIMSDKGNIIGRFVDNKFISLDNLENKEAILAWYIYCQQS
jgi:hypothetical protein